MSDLFRHDKKTGYLNTPCPGGVCLEGVRLYG